MRGSPGKTGSSLTNHRVRGGTPRVSVCHARDVPCPGPGCAAGGDAGLAGGPGGAARSASGAGAAGPPARGPARWDDAELARLRGFLRAVDEPRGRRGRVYPLEYLLALPLIAGMAGDGELDAAGEWAA